MNAFRTTLTALLIVLAAPFAIGSASAAPSTPIGFGMDSASISGQTNAGVKPDYGTFWIGPWTLTSGWGGPDAQLDAMVKAGVTPAIQFYYWGDDITPSCVENGCWSSLHNAQKDKAHWQLLAQQLVQHLNDRMGGRPVVLLVETEFNKGGIETYEPMDGYFADMVAYLRQGYPAAKMVMPLGNWGSNAWGTWDRFAAASDMVGLQGLRGSTRQSLANYGTLYEGLLAGAKTVQAQFHKPILFDDIALSSYPEPDWLQPQADTLQELFTNLPALKSLGLTGVIYRSWLDSPGMSTANYYGIAERSWGLAHASDGSWKPAAKVWVDGVLAERAGTTPTPPAPVAPPPLAAAAGTVTEAEAMATRSAGGAQADAAASGGKAWNLWSNGELAQAYNVSGSLALTVRARGTPLGGVAPHMDVYVGAAKALAADPGTAYQDYTVAVGPGAATVRIVFTNDAASSTEDRNLVVDTLRFAAPNQPPAAAFAATMDGLMVALDASASSDPDGDALSYAWAFGDGATSTGATASHAYAAGGSYTVTLTVSDGKASASATQAVLAVKPNAAPTAGFQASASGLTVAVDASGSSDPDGDALTYAWAFGDGATATGATASHAYAAGGSYTVTLTVSDGKASASATQAVLAVKPNAAPVAAFQATASSLSVALDAAGSSDPDGDALTYAWAFGDGATATGATASHAYAAGGSYTVTLTVSDGKANATATKTVQATAPAPTFAYGPTFTVASGSNEWWVDVRLNAPAAKVEANAGSGWVQLPATSWGTFAKSLHVLKGTPVTFRATSATGQVATSASLAWLAAASVPTVSMVAAPAPTPAPAPAPTFTATFSPKAVGNDWWIEVGVKSSQAVAKVEARLNGGAWTALPKTSWGNYAASLHAVNGTKVEFRATATTGATALSQAVTWT